MILQACGACGAQLRSLGWRKEDLGRPLPENCPECGAKLDLKRFKIDVSSRQEESPWAR
jgi:DNA-directed RNA polymerase subunit RPC12/RpoP